MADTTRYVGDTDPMEFQIADETGPLTAATLEACTSRTLLAVGSSGTFSGPVTVIDPIIDDADGVHHWNAKYAFATGDTSVADVFDLYCTVTLPDTTVKTFAVATLEVKAKS